MSKSKDFPAKPGNAYKKEHPNMTTMSYIESNCKANKKVCSKFNYGLTWFGQMYFKMKQHECKRQDTLSRLWNIDNLFLYVRMAMQATLDMMPTEAKPKMDKHNHKGLDDILRLLKIRKKNFKCSLTLLFSLRIYLEKRP